MNLTIYVESWHTFTISLSILHHGISTYNARIVLLEMRAFQQYTISGKKWFLLRYATKTHNHHHNHDQRRRKWPPTAPNEASSPTTTQRMDVRQPPEQVVIILGGVRGCMALKALLCSGDDASPQHRSSLRAIHPLNLRKNMHLLEGSSPIEQ